MAPNALMATEMNMTQDPALPTYFSVKPLNCKLFFVLKVVSATYNIIIVVKTPVKTIQKSSTGHPASLEPKARLNTPAPILVPTIKETPSSNDKRVFVNAEPSLSKFKSFSTDKSFIPFIFTQYFTI